jgi:hypothetical protein
VPAFLKFGARKYMELLLNEGLLHMRSLSYFIDLEDDDNRADSEEGLAALFQGQLITIEMAGHTLDGVVSASVRRDTTEHFNVYCMYALKDDSLYVDPLNIGFGDTVVIIYRLGEFYRRLQTALAGRGYKCDFVEYIDPTLHHGELGPFRKFNKYKHQSEYRILLRDGSPDPVDVRLGSLRDIAQIHDSATINEQIRLTNHLLPPRRDV